jgi:HPt (histidine-containing phosphotransfer) domain-containing protein
VAGNIGAEEVQAASKRLETAIREETDTDDLIKPLDRTLGDLLESLTSLAASADKVSVAPSNLDPSNLLPQLNRLQALLEDFDSEAGDLVMEIEAQTANTEYAQPIREIGTCLDDFEFDEALALLTALTEGMKPQTSVTASDAGLCTDRFLVERMMPRARAEFLAGVKSQPGVGLALIVGAGGVEVERLRDFRTLLLPSTRWQIAEALSALTIVRRLKLDETSLSEIVEAIFAIAHFAEDHRGVLAELDVNRLILCENGEVFVVGAFSAREFFSERAVGADRARAIAFLRAAPDVPPMAGDELPND